MTRMQNAINADNMNRGTVPSRTKEKLDARKEAQEEVVRTPFEQGYEDGLACAPERDNHPAHWSLIAWAQYRKGWLLGRMEFNGEDHDYHDLPGSDAPDAPFTTETEK